MRSSSTTRLITIATAAAACVLLASCKTTKVGKLRPKDGDTPSLESRWKDTTDKISPLAGKEAQLDGKSALSGQEFRTTDFATDTFYRGTETFEAPEFSTDFAKMGDQNFRTPQYQGQSTFETGQSALGSQSAREASTAYSTDAYNTSTRGEYAERSAADVSPPPDVTKAPNRGTYTVEEVRRLLNKGHTR